MMSSLSSFIVGFSVSKLSCVEMLGKWKESGWGLLPWAKEINRRDTAVIETVVVCKLILSHGFAVELGPLMLLLGLGSDGEF